MRARFSGFIIAAALLLPAVAQAGEVKQLGSNMVWLRCPLGQTWSGSSCAGKAKSMNWSEAMKACPAGYRLPTRREFMKLLGGCDKRARSGGIGRCASCGKSARCSSMFGKDLGWYWSSSYAGGSSGAWGVYFSYGAVSNAGEYAPSNVRCVRKTAGVNMNIGGVWAGKNPKSCSKCIKFAGFLTPNGKLIRWKTSVSRAKKLLTGKIDRTDFDRRRGVRRLELSGVFSISDHNQSYVFSDIFLLFDKRGLSKIMFGGFSEFDLVYGEMKSVYGRKHDQLEHGNTENTGDVNEVYIWFGNTTVTRLGLMKVANPLGGANLTEVNTLTIKRKNDVRCVRGGGDVFSKPEEKKVDKLPARAGKVKQPGSRSIYRDIDNAYRKAISLRNIGKDREYEKYLDIVVDNYKKLDEKDRNRFTRKAVAHARFLQLETEFNDYINIKLVLPPRTLKRNLFMKIDIRSKLEKKYEEVVGFKDTDWSIAALVRIGQLSQNLSQSMYDAPVPASLTPDQQDVYFKELRNHALLLNNKAIVFYRKVIEVSSSKGISNDWTIMAQELLRKYMTQKNP